ncbi:MAG TPA: YihY/virulence factor BrkB family protein [Thermodesulfobacteriota bacterium]|nr:YihY/virulence factor BrkB family protein [Thermodesulfobacteriota bacterium]
MVKGLLLLFTREKSLVSEWKRKIRSHWNLRLRFELKQVWDIFDEARRAFLRDGCMDMSAALAFYTILSLIPFLILVISAADFILGSERAQEMAVSFMARFFPQASTLIVHEVKEISRGAGLLGWAGFFTMIWSARAVFTSLETSIGTVFRVGQRRGFTKSSLLALSMIPGSGLIVLLSLFVTAFADFGRYYDVRLLGWSFAHSALFEFLVGVFFPYIVLALAITALYKMVPNTAVAFHHAVAGGASCAFLFELAKHFFTWQVSQSGQYGLIYGSLETMVIMVIWVFYSSTILLFCAEVVSAYRRRDVTLLQNAFL